MRGGILEMCSWVGIHRMWQEREKENLKETPISNLGLSSMQRRILERKRGS